MDDFLKQDIFFVVATVATVVLAGLLVVLLVYFIRISKNIDYIITKAKEETDAISLELGVFRKNVRETGFKLKHVINFFSSIKKKK